MQKKYNLFLIKRLGQIKLIILFIFEYSKNKKGVFDMRKKGLIYCYKYLPNNKCYIGQTTNFKKRQK